MKEDEFDEMWWVDCVEGELTEEEILTVNTLLERSETDRLVVENLKRLKKILKKLDEFEEPKETYFMQLHDQIMNQLDFTSVEGAAPSANVIPLIKKQRVGSRA